MAMLSGKTEVSYGRYAALKGALKLEALGMKTRGGPLRPRLAEEFGLKPRDGHDLYIAHCVGKMEELLEARREELLAEEALV